jgi:glyoxylate reductase
MPKILISGDLLDGPLALARSRAEVDQHSGADPLPKPDLIARLHDKDGLVCLITDIVDEQVVSQAPRLKVIANVAVGYDNIDVAAARRRGIVVTNTPDVLTETTADFTWALMLAAARRAVEADRFVRSGQWRKWEFLRLLGTDVHGKTLGIVGFGRIGRGVGRRALGFGMRVLYHDAVRADPPVEQELRATFTDLAMLLRDSDFVTLHCALTPETHHLIDAGALGRMKPSAILINAARGPIVDEAALVEALRGRRIAGAGLDVFEHEPTVHPGLLQLDNVVLAPHIASATEATRIKMATLAVENCLAVLEGKPPPTSV